MKGYQVNFWFVAPSLDWWCIHIFQHKDIDELGVFVSEGQKNWHGSNTDDREKPIKLEINVQEKQIVSGCCNYK